MDGNEGNVETDNDDDFSIYDCTYSNAANDDDTNDNDNYKSRNNILKILITPMITT